MGTQQSQFGFDKVKSQFRVAFCVTMHTGNMEAHAGHNDDQYRALFLSTLCTQKCVLYTYNGYGSPKTFCRIGFRGIWPLLRSPQILCTDTKAFLPGMSLHSTFTCVYGGGLTFGGMADADSTKA